MPLNTTSVTYDASNASRDPKELALYGRFRLKDLAMKIGMGGTPEARSSLASQEIHLLAEAVAAQLARLDAESGGPPPPTAPLESAPQAPQEAAPQPEPAKRTRTPRGPAPMAPTAAPAPMAAPGMGELVEAVKALSQVQMAIQDELRGVQKQVGDLTTLIAHEVGEYKVNQRLAIALSLFFAEEVLGGSRENIVGTAVEQLPQISNLLGKALQGK